MADLRSLAPLLAALRDLAAWFADGAVPGVVIGGVAASILGRPRATRDVDALVLLEEERWPAFLAQGGQFGFVPRREDCLAFASEARVLLVHHAPSGIDTDVALGILPFEEHAVEHATWVDVGGVHIPLPRPEDLIIMKAVAHRPRDLADIEAIVDASPGLDRERVLLWGRAFAEAAEMPEILRSLEAVLAGHGDAER